MDRCTRWFYTGVALALEVTGPLAVTAGEGAEPRVPGDHDRCPVCGMFVASHPWWIAQIVYEDGHAVFFDGGKDLFSYLQARKKDSRDLDGPPIAAIFVTSYYDRKPIDARTASFVVGSDVLGPMGPELVPHASFGEASEFSRDHDGSKIVGFDDVTPDLIAGLH
jgi:nitrous oxide reductase accessory protein NosL